MRTTRTRAATSPPREPDAHSLCEHKLKTALGIPSEDPTENLTWYNEEMEECASGYAAYVLELLAEAKKVTTDPIVLIEQRLDYSKYVESGFGTGDCVLIADGTLNIVDYKHGKGVEVSADHNPQMMLYALGALEIFDALYDIDTVTMTIYQPRRSNVSTYTVSTAELLEWAETVLKPTAALAFSGEGEFHWRRVVSVLQGESGLPGTCKSEPRACRLRLRRASAPHR